jgi:putative tryptophan/tyrosine transport system substrate-binding protein
MLGIGRREFITLLGGAVAAWPLAGRAQQPAMPVIGLLSGADREASQLDAIWRGLNEAGYVEGRNVAIEYRWAEGHFDQLPALATDLVRRQVAVIVAIQSAAAPLAATATIPIVFSIGGDAVKLGLVSSLNRPGGNATGRSFLYNTLAPKRLELLRELVPNAAVIGLLINPKNPASSSETSDVQAAARTLGLKIVAQNASSSHDIDAAFASFVQQRVNALTFAADSVFNSHRDWLIALAARHVVPTMYFAREFTDAGGLMSGAIKAYAVTAKSRFAAAADIPTVDEAGVPGVHISGWFALFAPKGTPKEVTNKLNAAVMEALGDPNVRTQLTDLGQEIPSRDQQTPEALGAFHKAEVEKWWPIIKAANIKAE